MNPKGILTTLLLASSFTAAAPAAAEPPPLIARDILFGNPEKTSPQISPDGKKLAWIAPDKKNVLQVWVKTIGASDDKVITADKKRGIRMFQWAMDGRTLLYNQDADGDENWHVYGVDLPTGSVRDYTPFQGVQGGILDINEKYPESILVALNVRDKKLHDVYRCDLKTGALTVDTQNPGDVAGWTVDNGMVVRGAQVSLPDGGTELRVRDDAKSPWRTLLKASQEETVDLHGFTPDDKGVLIGSSLGSDTTRLVERDLASGKEKVIAERKDVDAGSVVVHPTKHHVQAVSFARGRTEWQVVDPSVKDDFAALKKVYDGDFGIINRDLADKTWLVAYTLDRGPVRFYAYDRASKKAKFLFVHQPKLEGLKLSEMKAFTVTARDGLKLPVYLTLPAGYAGKNLPLVLNVHGGPWARDRWGFRPDVQWFANRGYAVLQVNFRGSTGYGKKHLHAGDKQWGKAMHTDLLDAVAWAVKEGYADPKRVAIYGGSYGGYSALAGAAFSPDVFKCAVDIVGPSNLFTLLKTIPPYWQPMVALFHSRMGDPEKDKELLKAASPLFSADKIRIPMLIGQGANDPRVNQAEAEQIVAALEKNGQHAVYVLYSDEGHGFARPENRIDFNARSEKFLHEHLGGRFEPLVGDKIPGSSAVVKEVGKKVSAN
ncbi:MAG: acylamino acid-releasing enzyme [Myxococcales bacterium]|nr:acylamino acid-releasing enzyme [Myxococcales bacterium]